MLCIKGVSRMPRKAVFRLTITILVSIILWIVWYSTTHDFDEAGIKENNNNNGEMMSAGRIFKEHSKKVLSLVNLPINLSSIQVPQLDFRGGKDVIVQSSGRSSLTGLTCHSRNFYLNNKPISIFSGAMHYFRIVPEYWEDRLSKLKACGLNTVETYVAWNLHEPSPGVFDFTGRLDLRSFIALAGKMGLYVILRPGPFICSEFEFGGLPGWLLSDPQMKVRTNYPGYVSAVNKFFSVLLPMVHDLQYTEGGPIIMYQVENEYSAYGENIEHLKLLMYLMKGYGVKEFLVTSDHKFKDKYVVDKKLDFSKYALPTDNFDIAWSNSFSTIRSLNEHFPVMVMEFWTGWFDYWGKRMHSVTSIKDVNATLNFILDNGGSFNLYMFVGGTNFGFTAGAINISGYQPLVTSYDYDAILTEAGDITPKYNMIRKRLLQFYNSKGIKDLPDVPPNTMKEDYGSIEVTEMIRWDTFLSLIPIASVDKKVNFMETYKDHHGHHSTLGYIIYSHIIDDNENLRKLTDMQLKGYVNDRLLAILNGENFFTMDKTSKSEGSVIPYYDWDPHWRAKSLDDYFIDHKSDYDVYFTQPQWQPHFLLRFKESITRLVRKRIELPYRLDLVVENLGRVNFSPREDAFFDFQRKGISQGLFRQVSDIFNKWSIRFLNFSPEQCKMLSESDAWTVVPSPEKTRKKEQKSPTLYRAYFTIHGSPNDTFVKLDGWNKGIVIVNGFNLGRYWHVGPQWTLYLPAPLLRTGKNEIMIFEEIKSGKKIRFQDFAEV